MFLDPQIGPVDALIGSPIAVVGALSAADDHRHRRLEDDAVRDVPALRRHHVHRARAVRGGQARRRKRLAGIPASDAAGHPAGGDQSRPRFARSMPSPRPSTSSWQRPAAARARRPWSFRSTSGAPPSSACISARPRRLPSSPSSSPAHRRQPARHDPQARPSERPPRARFAASRLAPRRPRRAVITLVAAADRLDGDERRQDGSRDQQHPTDIPAAVASRWTNFVQLFEQFNFGLLTINSVIVSALGRGRSAWCSAGRPPTASRAIRSGARRLLLNAILVTRMITPASLVLPLYLMMDAAASHQLACRHHDRHHHAQSSLCGVAAEAVLRRACRGRSRRPRCSTGSVPSACGGALPSRSPGRASRRSRCSASSPRGPT